LVPESTDRLQQSAKRCLLAVITVIEARYAGLGYAGDSAQKKAAAFHAQAQAQGDWREDGAYRQREEETAAPFFGGFGGG
jgi:hypothetical protein